MLLPFFFCFFFIFFFFGRIFDAVGHLKYIYVILPTILVRESVLLFLELVEFQSG